MGVDFTVEQGVKTAIIENYAGQRRIDIHLTQTPSLGYRSDVDHSSKRVALSLECYARISDVGFISKHLTYVSSSI